MHHLKNFPAIQYTNFLSF